MKKKNRIWIYPLVIMGLLLMLTNSCKKDDDNNNNPTPIPTPTGQPILTTSAVSDITMTTATCGGNITSIGSAPVTARGVCWRTGQNPTIVDSTTTDGTGAGSFTSAITGLTANATYYVRAYATNSAGTSYGSAMSFSTSAPAIGQSFQGGIIAYILQPGDPGYDTIVPHGLIAAPSDQSTDIWWYNGFDFLTFAAATGLGTGNANTNTIVKSYGAGWYAALLCYDLVLGGYSDWYLPSLDELNKLYLNQGVIGGFSHDYYWSSSEYNFNGAWVQFFGSGSQYFNYKNSGNRVRAVRSF